MRYLAGKENRLLIDMSGVQGGWFSLTGSCRGAQAEGPLTFLSQLFCTKENATQPLASLTAARFTGIILKREETGADLPGVSSTQVCRL